MEILVCAAILGALSGFLWADMHIRKTMRHAKQIRQSMHRLRYWAQQYWAANYTGYVFPTASNSDATPEDASATDAE